MDIERICYGCFREKDPGVCPYCGFDEAAEQPFLALPLGTILNGRYMVGKVLGIGGFGITYLGFDLTLEIKVAIKEYMPAGMATRSPERYTVTLTGRLENEYRAGEEKFLDEARILAKLQESPHIVSVQNYFRENNTAYFVMEYIEGMSLKEYLAEQGGKIPYSQAMAVLEPIMEALIPVHSMNLIHRDISPDNIYITSKGESKLLDFGAARFSMGEGKSVSVILKHGYAPEEQYSTHGNQGPWTDVYALGATLYHCVTGILPPDSIERIREDRIVSPHELGVKIPEQAERALMKALAIQPEERFPNMTQFMDALSGKLKIGGKVTESVQKKSRRYQEENREKEATEQSRGGFLQKLKESRSMQLLTGGALLLIIALAVLIPVLTSGNKKMAAKTGGGSISSGKSAQTPSDSDSSWSGQMEEKDLGILNATISVPSGYTASEDGFTYTDSKKGRAVEASFIWNMGMPIYSVADVENYREEILDQYAAQVENFKNYEILTAGADEVNGESAYQIYFEGETDKGTEIEMIIMAIDGQNGFGCYFVTGAYLKGDEDGQQEIYDIIKSFQSKGKVDVTYQAYASKSAGVKFICDSSQATGGVQEESSKISSGTLQYVAVYPTAEESAIEIEMADMYASNASEAMAYFHSGMSSNPSTTVGDPYTKEIGGVTWQFRDYHLNSYLYSYAAADINGKCCVAAIWTSEANQDATINLWGQVLQTLRPL